MREVGVGETNPTLSGTQISPNQSEGEGECFLAFSKLNKNFRQGK